MRHARQVVERWSVQDGARLADGGEALRVVEERISRGAFETWFESDHGRMMAIVTNGDRALLMVLRATGDAGEHLIDPRATDREQGGYELSNGQSDTYAERDTVPLRTALQVVASVVDGENHPTASWQEDR